MEGPRYARSAESGRRTNAFPLNPGNTDSASWRASRNPTSWGGPPSPSKAPSNEWAFSPSARAVGAVLLVLGIAVLVSLIAFTVQYSVQSSNANAAALAAANAKKCPEMTNVELVRAEQEFNQNMQQRSWRLSQIPKKKAGITPEYVKKYWLIPTYSCPYQVRLGMWGDGGKWVCVSNNEDKMGPLVFSIGHKRNRGASFEQEIRNQLYGFSITFDYAFRSKTRAKMLKLEYLNFYSYGVTGSEQVQNYTDFYKTWYPDVEFITLPEAMEKVNVSSADILKLDCGGCEYGIINDWIGNYTVDTVPFNQVLMELNDVWKTPYEALLLIQELEKLGFRLFHTEIDPGKYDNFELAFVHQRVVVPKVQVQMS